MEASKFVLQTGSRWLATLALVSVACAAQANMMSMPAGVMVHHPHKSGQWMLSYQYNRMGMDGNRDGTRDISTAEVLEGFMVSPLDMDMEMHMLSLMYGSDRGWTMMAMLPYIHKSMELVNRQGARFKTRSSGVGDIKLLGIYELHNFSEQRRLLLNVGLSLPLGQTDKKDDTPAGNIKLPYPMQLGSGTFDPILGFTYIDNSRIWSWGVQAKTNLRFGKNDEGYRWGHEYEAITWATKRLGDDTSVSFRLDGKAWGNIRGRDEDLNPQMVPTARSDLRGGKRIDALLELSRRLYGHRFAATLGLPIYQDLDGPQLETDYRFILNWQKML